MCPLPAAFDDLATVIRHDMAMQLSAESTNEFSKNMLVPWRGEGVLSTAMEDFYEMKSERSRSCPSERDYGQTGDRSELKCVKIHVFKKCTFRALGPSLEFTCPVSCICIRVALTMYFSLAVLSMTVGTGAGLCPFAYLAAFFPIARYVVSVKFVA